MTTKRNEVGAHLAVVALGIAVAVGVVVFRQCQQKAEQPAIKLFPPPNAAAEEKLNRAIGEVTARLDAQEDLVKRVEDRTLPTKMRIQAVEEAVAAVDQVGEALVGLSRELKAAGKGGGVDADRAKQLSLRVEELMERMTRLHERFEAAMAQLEEEERKGPRKD